MNNDLEKKYGEVFKRAFKASITIPLITLIYISMEAMLEINSTILLASLWIIIMIELVPVFVSSVKVTIERRRKPIV